MLVSPLLRWIEKIYSFVVFIGNNLQSLLLLYMRMTWGHQFFLTGLAKLKDIDSMVKLLDSIHFPAPEFHSWEVAIIEMIGGLCLFFGFASRLAAIPLMVICMTALSTIHSEYLSHFRFVTDPLILVIQQPYPFMLTAMMVLTFGPGRISIDAWIKRWISKQPRY